MSAPSSKGPLHRQRSVPQVLAQAASGSRYLLHRTGVHYSLRRLRSNTSNARPKLQRSALLDLKKDRDGDGFVTEDEVVLNFIEMELQPGKNNSIAKKVALRFLLGQRGAAPGGYRNPKVQEQRPLWRAVMDLLEHPTVQAVFYCFFCTCFCLLAFSVRSVMEYHLAGTIEQRIIHREFTVAERGLTFDGIQDASDFWSWGKYVLWPALFAATQPCGTSTSPVGFNSWTTHSSNPEPLEERVSRATSTCNPHAWPDLQQTPYSVGSILTAMDTLDWSAGIQIRQQRVRSLETTTMPGVDNPCEAAFVGDFCLPELGKPTTYETQPFGFNFTHPYTALDAPFRWLSREQLGAQPETSTRRERSYDSSGYVAVILPFFSNVLLPEQRGTADTVIDYRLHYANRFDDREARYFCVRLSWNGDLLHQVCDPVPSQHNRSTVSVVRLAVDEFWESLQRAHFIDANTRVVSVIAPLRSNHFGLRAQLSMVVEFSSTFFVQPSYLIETAIENAAARRSIENFMDIVLALTIMFMFVEAWELWRIGLVVYLFNMWNWFDWITYALGEEPAVSSSPIDTHGKSYSKGIALTR
eukprot:7391030-Prymnesium_polylepis.1